MGKVIPFPNRAELGRDPARLAAQRPTIAALLPAYERSLIADGNQARGRARYLGQLRDLAAFLGLVSVAQVSSADLRHYQEYLAARGNRGSSRQVALSAMRSFFGWCVAEGLRPDNPASALKWPKREDPPRRALSAEVLERLRRHLVEPAGLDDVALRAWRRNRRCVLLMLHGGLRVTEATELDWDQVNLRRRMLTVRGKGGKVRSIPINRTLLQELQLVPEHDRVGSVLPTDIGRPFSSYKTLARCVFDRWVQADFDLDVTAHQLRHAFALRLLERRVDVRRIQVLLGHASLETTQIYLGLDAEDTRSAVELLDEEE